MTNYGKTRLWNVQNVYAYILDIALMSHACKAQGTDEVGGADSMTSLLSELNCTSTRRDTLAQQSDMMAAYPPPSAAYPPSSRGPSTRVELHLSCKGLKKADVLSKSDPLVAVYSPAVKGWTEV